MSRENRLVVEGLGNSFASRVVVHLHRNEDANDVLATACDALLESLPRKCRVLRAWHQDSSLKVRKRHLYARAEKLRFDFLELRYSDLPLHPFPGTGNTARRLDSALQLYGSYADDFLAQGGVHVAMTPIYKEVLEFDADAILLYEVLKTNVERVGCKVLLEGVKKLFVFTETTTLQEVLMNGDRVGFTLSSFKKRQLRHLMERPFSSLREEDIRKANRCGRKTWERLLDLAGVFKNKEPVPANPQFVPRPRHPVMVSPSTAPLSVEGLLELSRSVRQRLALQLNFFDTDDQVTAFSSLDDKMQCEVLIAELKKYDVVGKGSA